MKKSTKTFNCSDATQNVYGLKVNTEGIDTTGFEQNPVLLLNHNYDKVMGTWVDLQKVDGKLTATPVFDTEDEEANKFYGKVERDMIKGASIGIIPLSVVNKVIVKSELLEISLTPVPANRNALVLYNNKGQQLSAQSAEAYLLSINQPFENTEKENMNPKLIAIVSLMSAQAKLPVQLSATPTDAEVENALNGIANKLTALELSNQQLTAANDASLAKEQAAKELEKTNLLNLAVSEKRITEAQRETFSKLFDADADLAKSTLEALKPVNLTAIPGAVQAAAATAQDAEKANWTFDDYAEKAPLELSAMRDNNADKFNGLYNAKVNAMRANGAID